MTPIGYKYLAKVVNFQQNHQHFQKFAYFCAKQCGIAIEITNHKQQETL